MSFHDMRLHIFVFILHVSMFVITGIALHDTNAVVVMARCTMLWEMTLSILVIKCVSLTLCPLLFTVFRMYSKWIEPFNVGVYGGFFIAECVLTSRSLNSPDCLVATSLSTGHPILVFINFALCIFDGAFVLSHALYTIIHRF